jgi:hypothetical protein
MIQCRTHRWRGAIGWAVAVALCACTGAHRVASDRYPEKKRPEAPRSASDDEVLGAQEQDPADTLDASLTNEHPAPRSPHAEQPNEAAHERLEIEECIEANSKPPASSTDAPRRRPVCPPLSDVEKPRD